MLRRNRIFFDGSRKGYMCTRKREVGSQKPKDGDGNQLLSMWLKAELNINKEALWQFQIMDLRKVKIII